MNPNIPADYENYFKEMPSCLADEVNKSRNATKFMMQALVSQLTERFFDAVNSFDSQAILDMAKTVELFKKFNSTVDSPGDQMRCEILRVKRVLDAHGEKWTIREIAKWLKQSPSDSTDGFSRLRRLCKDLKFPLADSRPTRSKKVIKSLIIKKNKPSSRASKS